MKRDKNNPKFSILNAAHATITSQMLKLAIKRKRCNGPITNVLQQKKVWHVFGFLFLSLTIAMLLWKDDFQSENINGIQFGRQATARRCLFSILFGLGWFGNFIHSFICGACGMWIGSHQACYELWKQLIVFANRSRSYRLDLCDAFTEFYSDKHAIQRYSIPQSIAKSNLSISCLYSEGPNSCTHTET